MTATRIAWGATLTALLGLWLLAAVLLWETEVPPDLVLPDLEPRAYVSAPLLEQTRAYTNGLRLLWLAGMLATLGVLVPLAVWGPGLAARLRGGPILRGTTLLAGVLAAVWLARAPFRLAGHWWRRRYGISSQAYVDWLLDPWLELAGAAGIALAALAVAMFLARRLGSRWWIPGGGALAVLGAAVVLVQPLLLAPRLEPLRDRELTAEIRELARALDLDASTLDVEVRHASRRTRRANAEVTGLGPTRTVVLWDTLLDGRFRPEEIRFLAAHELAHVARDHLWKGLAWFGLLAGPLVFVVARTTRLRGGLGEPGAAPLAVLVVVVLELALLPFANAISRRYEAEADWVALEATHDPVAAQTLFRRLVATNLAQPDPPGWTSALLATHPSLLERIALADGWVTRTRTRTRTRRRAEESRAGS